MSIITIAEAATSRKLVDLSYARQMLGVDTATMSDQKLENLIDAQSAFVESWCSRKLIRETVTERFRFRQPQETLFLDRTPVEASSVSSIIENAVALTTDQWELDYESGQLWRLSSECRLPWGGYGPCPRAMVVEVSYAGGYIPADDTGSDVPADLRDGVLELIKAARFGLGRDPYLRSEEVPGVQIYGYGFGAAAQSSSGIAPEAEALLTKYRRLAFG